MGHRIVPLDPATAAEVRRTRRAPGYGHPAHAELAAGYGPCRLCLQPFRIGEEERVLFTYDPFRDQEPFPLPGPVFVHAAECAAYGEQDRFPQALRFLPLTLNAYGRGRTLRRVVRLEPNADADAAIEALLADADVACIHVRNTEAGCFILRVERA